MQNSSKTLIGLAALLALAACSPEPAGSQEGAATAEAPAETDVVAVTEVAEVQPWNAEELAIALAAANRPEGDAERDVARKPAEVLAFAGVAPGMTAMDVMASGGWYTEVLSIAVGPEGTVYAENPRWLLEVMNGAPDKALTKRLADDRLPNVVRKDAGLEEGTIPAGSVDVALTALNFHDVVDSYGDEAGITLLKQIYAALKPGGVLILIDHSGAAGNDNKKLHRIEEAKVKELVGQTGFVMEEEGAMLRHPEDDKSAMVFGPGVRGKTDRFVWKLRKPA